MSTIFHITTSTQWEKALLSGFYLPPTFNDEGFIHASLPRQLSGVVERHYRQQNNLVLLEIEKELIRPKVLFEGVADTYPHIYGELNLDCVIAVHKFDNHSLPFGTSLIGETYIRPARPSDAGEIANCHLNSWREIYQGLIPKDYLDNLPLSFKRRQVFWREQITSGGSYVVVAETEQHGVNGFANVGESRDDEFPNYGELRAVYLLKAYQNLGIGIKLVQLGFDYLTSKGFKSAYCWVLEGNPTIKFYEKTGGKMSANSKSVDLGKDLREFLCKWDNLSEVRVNLTQKKTHN